MGKDTFIIYKSFYGPISALSDKQLGRLFRAIFEYNISGVVSVEADIEMAFKFFKNQFDLDNDKYQSKVERNRENGRRGGNQKAENQKDKQKSSNGHQTLANASESSECKRNLANLAYNDNDNDIKEKELSKESPKKKVFDLSFVSAEYLEAFQEWLDYKKARKETYKTQASLQKCYNNLLEFSNNDPDIARRIIDQSIANNWAGLFELKQSGKVSIQPRGESVPNGLKLGIGERIENGRRTYGSGRYNIPMDAPPRPREGTYWNESNRQWVTG